MSIREIKIDTPTHATISNNINAICLTDAFVNAEAMKRKVKAAIGMQVALELSQMSLENCPNKALVIRNLPMGANVPATPSHSQTAAVTQTPATKSLLLALGLNLGTPIGFQSENNGAIIHNICPLEDKAKSKSGQGAKQPLGMHSDFAFSEKRPDWLMLLCLRNNQSVPTALCLVDDAVSRLSAEDLSTLQKDAFLIHPPESSSLNTPISSPILLKTETGYNSRFNKDRCSAKTPEAQKALDAFSEAAIDATRNILLEAGDLLIFDNKATLHGRRTFTPKFDGTDRWLQRVYCHRPIAEAHVIYDTAA